MRKSIRTEARKPTDLMSQTPRLPYYITGTVTSHDGTAIGYRGFLNRVSRA
jgi:hypothetical protein